MTNLFEDRPKQTILLEGYGVYYPDASQRAKARLGQLYLTTQGLYFTERTPLNYLIVVVLSLGVLTFLLMIPLIAGGTIIMGKSPATLLVSLSALITTILALTSRLRNFNNPFWLDRTEIVEVVPAKIINKQMLFIRTNNGQELLLAPDGNAHEWLKAIQNVLKWSQQPGI